MKNYLNTPPHTSHNTLTPHILNIHLTFSMHPIFSIHPTFLKSYKAFNLDKKMPTGILTKDAAWDLKNMWVVFKSTIKTHLICF